MALISLVDRNRQWFKAKVGLSVQETSRSIAFSNAIKHGCDNDARKSVQCCVTCEDSGEIMIVVRDPGPGFQPSEVDSPVAGANLVSIHGRGLYLINQFMDDVKFESEGREIQMRKRSRAGSSRRS
jgi:anti-sigma regulatory factor (Ser/Thr protein kinase)